MSQTVLPPAVRAVLASNAWNGSSNSVDRVDVVGQPPGTLVTSESKGQTRYALYDDFGQLKATLPKEYDAVPTLAFVGGGALPGASGVTVEILDDAQSTGIRSLLDTLEAKMRPGFAADMEALAARFGDVDMPTVRDYGVYRNLARALLARYDGSLSSEERAALQQFEQACAAKSEKWSFAADRDFLLPGMSADFPSLR